jgi:sugar-specific transcriptional regulator TrmB
MVFVSNPDFMLQHFLRSTQMSEKEIKIFLKLLELGAQPASNIARLCELPRNTVRSILDKLGEEGFLQKTRRANTQYYSPETQENIAKMLRLQKVKQSAKTGSTNGTS